MKKKTLFRMAQRKSFALVVDKVIIKKNHWFKQDIYEDRSEEAFCVVNPKYIFCYNKEEAIEIYKDRYGINTDTRIYADINRSVSCSENLGRFPIVSNDGNGIKIVDAKASSEVICDIIDIGLRGNETADEIKELMTADDYMNWEMSYRNYEAPKVSKEYLVIYLSAGNDRGSRRTTENRKVSAFGKKEALSAFEKAFKNNKIEATVTPGEKPGLFKIENIVAPKIINIIELD